MAENADYLSRAEYALVKVTEKQRDTLTKQVKFRDDIDWLLYSIANSILALAKIEEVKD